MTLLVASLAMPAAPQLAAAATTTMAGSSSGAVTAGASVTSGVAATGRSGASGGPGDGGMLAAAVLRLMAALLRRSAAARDSLFERGSGEGGAGAPAGVRLVGGVAHALSRLRADGGGLPPGLLVELMGVVDALMEADRMRPPDTRWRGSAAGTELAGLGGDRLRLYDLGTLAVTRWLLNPALWAPGLPARRTSSGLSPTSQAKQPAGALDPTTQTTRRGSNLSARRSSRGSSGASGFETLGILAKELRNLSARDPVLLGRACGVVGLLDFVRWCHGRAMSATAAAAARRRSSLDRPVSGRRDAAFVTNLRDLVGVCRRVMEAAETLLSASTQGHFGLCHPTVPLRRIGSETGATFHGPEEEALAQFLAGKEASESIGLQTFGLELLVRFVRLAEDAVPSSGQHSPTGSDGFNISPANSTTLGSTGRWEAWLRVLISILCRTNNSNGSCMPAHRDVRSEPGTPSMPATRSTRGSRASLLTLAALAGVLQRSGTSTEEAFGRQGGYRAVLIGLQDCNVAVSSDSEETLSVVTGMLLRCLRWRRLASEGKSTPRDDGLSSQLLWGGSGFLEDGDDDDICIPAFDPMALTSVELSPGPAKSTLSKNDENAGPPLNWQALPLFLGFAKLCPPLLRQQALINLGLVLERSSENRRRFLELRGWADAILDLVCPRPKNVSRQKTWSGLPSVVTWLVSGNFVRRNKDMPGNGAPMSSNGQNDLRETLAERHDIGISEELAGLYTLGSKLLCSLIRYAHTQKDGWRYLADALTALEAWEISMLIQFSDSTGNTANSCSNDCRPHLSPVSMAVALLDAAGQVIQNTIVSSNRWDGHVCICGVPLQLQVIRENLGGLLVVCYLFSARRISRRVERTDVSINMDGSDEEIWSSGIERLLKLLHCVFSVNGSPSTGSVSRKCLCPISSASRRKGDIFGPWMWIQAAWFLCMERLIKCQSSDSCIRYCSLILSDIYPWKEKDAPVSEDVAARAGFTIQRMILITKINSKTELKSSEMSPTLVTRLDDGITASYLVQVDERMEEEDDDLLPENHQISRTDGDGNCLNIHSDKNEFKIDAISNRQELTTNGNEQSQEKLYLKQDTAEVLARSVLHIIKQTRWLNSFHRLGLKKRLKEMMKSPLDVLNIEKDSWRKASKLLGLDESYTPYFPAERNQDELLLETISDLDFNSVSITGSSAAATENQIIDLAYADSTSPYLDAALRFFGVLREQERQRTASSHEAAIHQIIAAEHCWERIQERHCYQHSAWPSFDRNGFVCPNAPDERPCRQDPYETGRRLRIRLQRNPPWSQINSTIYRPRLTEPHPVATDETVELTNSLPDVNQSDESMNFDPQNNLHLMMSDVNFSDPKNSNHLSQLSLATSSSGNIDSQIQKESIGGYEIDSPDDDEELEQHSSQKLQTGKSRSRGSVWDLGDVLVERASTQAVPANAILDSNSDDSDEIISVNVEIIRPSGVHSGILQVGKANINFKSNSLEGDEVEQLEASTVEIPSKWEPAVPNEPSLGGRKQWAIAQIVEIHGRRYTLQPNALELIFSDGQSTFINFTQGTQFAKRVYNRLVLLAASHIRYHYFDDPEKALQRYRITENWMCGRISNFEYLMQVNSFAGRTYNDLEQYFVMPWVLKDYGAASIDLSDPESYRDFSWPIAAQNVERRTQFRDRYRTWADPEIPKFHYGSHYSSSAIVLWYLIRLEPFTKLAQEFQGGQFDCADRIFRSVAEACSGTRMGMNDVKELIPEFFYHPEFLVNDDRLDLGCTQSRGKVGDVILPLWANGSPHEFIRIHRQVIHSIRSL